VGSGVVVGNSLHAHLCSGIQSMLSAEHLVFLRFFIWFSLMEIRVLAEEIELLFHISAHRGFIECAWCSE